MANDDRLARLNVLIGDWDTTITMIDGDGSDGAVSKASDIYSWSANGKFVLHDVDADMGGDRIQSLEVIAVNPSGEGYSTHSFDADGTFSDFAAHLEGRSWRIIGDAQRFAGEFSGDGTMLSGRWEQNDGSGNWSPLMKVTL